jgi:hypothetical protein
MRNFLYVSPTKVEMLYGQIGSTFFDKMKAGLKLKLFGFGEAQFEGETGKTLYAKAEAIRTHLLSTSTCGTIDSPKTYIDDTANLSYGHVVESASSMAFFGGTVGSKKVALIGSASSLVGAAPSVEANHAQYYYTMKFINEALSGGEESSLAKEKLPYVQSLEEAVDIAQRSLVLLPQPMQFTAITIHSSPTLLVATPVFVAQGS